ncbi:MAG: MOP flippase family protein [Flavipsychrobacter sp.]|nr:MOP flippase family protein [Flavipsychrobacter sp.]
MSLSETVFKGVKWTGLASLTGVLFQLIQTAILARILNASDFGIMGLALVVIGFSQLFLDAGFSAVIIQKEGISRDQLSSLFWLSIFIGFFFFLLLMLLAPVLADFYKEPRLTLVIRIISAGFLFVPLESFYLSLIQKNLEFKKIAQRDFISRTISFLVGVWAAYNGWGVFSLVVLHMTGIVISCFFIFKMGAVYFKPFWYFNLASIRSFFSFGFYVMGDNLINFVNRQIDVLLVGNFLGIQSLGLYNQGKNFAMRPYMVINPILTQVNFPLLSKHKGDVPLMKTLYLNTVRYLSLVNFPIYFFISVFSEEVVLVLFGEKWTGAIPIVQVLSLYILIRSIINPMGSLLMATGKPKRTFFWNLSILFITPVILLAAMPSGMVWVCLVQFILGLLLLVVHIYLMIGPVLGLELKEFFQNLAPFFLCVILAAAASWLVVHQLSDWPVFPRLVTAGILFFGSYLGAIFIFSRDTLIKLYSVIKNKPAT